MVLLSYYNPPYAENVMNLKHFQSLDTYSMIKTYVFVHHTYTSSKSHPSSLLSP